MNVVRWADENDITSQHLNTIILKAAIYWLVTLFGIISSTVSGTAQQPKPTWPKDGPKYHLIEIGLGFSPDVAYRTISPLSTANSGVLSNRQSFEIPKFGYRASLNINIYFTKKVGLVSGFAYYNRGFSTKPFTLHGSGGTIRYSGYSITNYMVEIPVGLLYRGAERRVRTLLSAGMELSILSASIKRNRNPIDGSFELGTVEPNLESPHFVQPAVFVSAGADIKLGKHLMLRVEPRFSALVYAYKFDDINTFLWNLGVNITFQVGFVERMSNAQRPKNKEVDGNTSTSPNG